MLFLVDKIFVAISGRLPGSGEEIVGRHEDKAPDYGEEKNDWNPIYGAQVRWNVRSSFFFQKISHFDSLVNERKLRCSLIAWLVLFQKYNLHYCF